MNKSIVITDYCVVENGIVSINGSVQYDGSTAETFGSFAKGLYQSLGLKYAKFYKMDNLSKLGFLAAESLFQQMGGIERFDKSKTGIFLSNSCSCLDTDERYYESIAEFPSPGLFVYTLPNILIGEICIRHKITGEHAFFLSDQFDKTFVCNYVADFFQQGQLEAALVGWVEYYDVNCQAYLMWLEPRAIAEDDLEFTPDNILKLFGNISGPQ